MNSEPEQPMPYMPPKSSRPVVMVDPAHLEYLERVEAAARDYRSGAHHSAHDTFVRGNVLDAALKALKGTHNAQ